MRTGLFVGVLCGPFHAQYSPIVLVGVGHFLCLFVLVGALVVALDLYVAEGGKRKGLVFKVFLCICCVPFPALLFMKVFPVIVPSFGVATCVTTRPCFLCMTALVATFSRCCVATLKQSSLSC